jgi:hypothetical protein
MNMNGSTSNPIEVKPYEVSLFEKYVMHSDSPSNCEYCSFSPVLAGDVGAMRIGDDKLIKDLILKFLDGQCCAAGKCQDASIQRASQPQRRRNDRTKPATSSKPSFKSTK